LGIGNWGIWLPGVPVFPFFWLRTAHWPLITGYWILITDHPHHRLHRFEIACTAAQHAGQRLAHFGFGWGGVFVEQGFGGQNLGRGAVSALDGAAFDESLLQRVQPVGFAPALLGVFAERFQGGDFMPLGLGGQHQGGVDRFSIQQNRVCAAQAVLVAKLDRMKAQPAQGREQAGVGRAFEVVLGSVDGKAKVHDSLLFWP
jgi:hypothetical protein